MQTGTILRWLANVQNTSAIVAATFMTVHLAAPLTAIVGGEHAATQTMMVGRVLYHGVPNEVLLVYAPIAIHLSAALARRVILLYKTRSLPRLNAHQAAGWALVPFLALHTLTNRIIPSDPSPPISALSPSELDYSFVGYGLSRWPIVSYTLYASLLATGLWHALRGSMYVAAWLGARRREGIVLSREESGRAKRRIGLRGLYLGLLGTLGVALVRIHRGSEWGGVQARRMDEVYRRIGWLYR